MPVKYEQPSNSIAAIEGAIDVAVNPNTMGDWDLAAPDAILRKAGGGFVSTVTGKLLEYGYMRTPQRGYLQQESVAGNLETLARLGLANKEVAASLKQRS